jgi:hypothetical protein
MRQRLQLLEGKVMETKGVRATTPQKAKGDGKKQPALKTVLKKGTAASRKKPTKLKAKTSTGNTPPSENRYAALANDNNNTVANKKPCAQNQQRSSSKSRKSGGSTSKSK